MSSPLRSQILLFCIGELLDNEAAPRAILRHPILAAALFVVPACAQEAKRPLDPHRRIRQGPNQPTLNRASNYLGSRLILRSLPERSG